MDWILDSGCTRHMTWNRNLFSSYESYDGGQVIFGGNSKGKVIGRGQISCNNVNFLNVEHVNNLNFNLPSIRQLCENDIKVVFEKYYCEFLKPTKLFSPVL